MGLPASRAGDITSHGTPLGPWAWFIDGADWRQARLAKAGPASSCSTWVFNTGQTLQTRIRHRSPILESAVLCSGWRTPVKKRVPPLVGATVLSVVLAACGGDGPSTPMAPTAPTALTPPSAGPVAGNWVGVFESSNYATRSIQLTLTHTGASMSITGTWEFPGAGQGQGGTISGTVDTANFIGTVSYYGNHDPACRASFAGTATNAALNWTSPGFTGVCGLSAAENPVGVQLTLQRP